MTERLIKFFGKDFSENERKHSYDFIETYISTNVQTWVNSPDTDSLAAAFAQEIVDLSQSDFAFLLSHSGYIPEFYEHDSKQETLYSKLLEVLVCEWAKRVGFIDSFIQKQKASKEDVTILLGNNVIVCDAKSYRLGRSQAAPNVKDTLKKADYENWQDFWRTKQREGQPYNTLGGLVTFPSMHRWKGSSDAYKHSTDKDKPIAIIFYEHLAFYLLSGFPADLLIDLFASYPEIFPEKSPSQHTYFQKILVFLFGGVSEEFFEFIKLFAEISAEKVAHTTERIESQLANSRLLIERQVEALNDVPALKIQLINALVKNQSGQLQKNLINIRKFRTTPISE
jgi:hypothetical protein